MALCLAAAGGCLRITVQHLANVRALLISHHTKVEADRCTISKRGECIGDKTLNLVTHRATSNGERDGERNALARNSHIAHHVEIDNGTVQFGVLDGAKGLDDLFNSCSGHAGSRGY